MYNTPLTHLFQLPHQKNKMFLLCSIMLLDRTLLLDSSLEGAHSFCISDSGYVGQASVAERVVARSCLRKRSADDNLSAGYTAF